MIITSILFLSFLTVLVVDASQKRREFLQKEHNA